jgi:hypothetical protein
MPDVFRTLLFALAQSASTNTPADPVLVLQIQPPGVPKDATWGYTVAARV